MSRNRPYTDFPRNEQGLVDNFIGTAYDTVKRVYDNLPEIQRLDDVLEEIPNLAQNTVDAALAEALPPIREELAVYVENSKEWAEKSEGWAQDAEESLNKLNQANQQFPFAFFPDFPIYDVTVISGKPEATTAGLALWVEGAIEYDFTILDGTRFTLNNPDLYPANTQMRIIINARFDDIVGNFKELQEGFTVEFDAAQFAREMAYFNEKLERTDDYRDYLMSLDLEAAVPYGAGLNLVRPTQTVLYDGVLYRARPEYLPFQTTNWAVDGSRFTVANDLVIAQELKNLTDLDKGVSVIGRSVVAVSNLDQLKATPSLSRRTDLRYLTAEYSAGTRVGEGTWAWSGLNMTAAVAADPYSALVAAPNSDPSGASGGFYRVFTGDMYADWFGVVYGQTVDATARLQAAISLVRAGRGLSVRGDVRIDGTLDMSNLPMAWKVKFNGTIYAGPGTQTTTRIAGIYADFEVFRYEKLGGVRDGLALECLSMFMGDIKVMSIDKFFDGAQFIGIHSRPDGVNGIAWCFVDIRNINVANVPVLITTRTDTPGKTNGYVNENIFQIGYMGGRKGIWCKEGPEQTGGAFGGNWFVKPGFEQITDVNDAALDLEFCSRTTISDWRFEGPGIKGLQIRENSKCSRNVYRGSHALTDTKIQFDGILATIDAEIITLEGGLVAVSARQLGIGRELSYSAGDAWAIQAHGDSLERRIREATLNYPARMQAQTPNGVRGFFEFRTRNWFQPATGAAIVDVLEGMNIIDVNVTVGGLIINMPIALEMLGRDILLNVTSFVAGATVRINKSSGTQTAGAGVTSAGLYSLAYKGDVWRISKIGEPYSQ